MQQRSPVGPDGVMRGWRDAAGVIGTLAAGLLLSLTLTGCLVAGYSSGGGFFLWPGSISLLVVILLIVFLLRRRR